MRHLPQASYVALIDRGVPQHEALRQIDELLLKFGLKRTCQKFDAFIYRNQWQKPQPEVDPVEKTDTD